MECPRSILGLHEIDRRERCCSLCGLPDLYIQAGIRRKNVAMNDATSANAPQRQAIVGNVVRLLSGGPAMTAVAWEPATFCQLLRCIWFAGEEGDESHEIIVAPSALEVVNA